MMKKTLILLTTTFLFGNAFGAGWEWDWPSVIENSEWSQETLDWFSDTHPQNPSDTCLLNNVTPPPREMWCIDSDWEENCDDWSQHMNRWLHVQLNIPLNQSLPSGIPDYPEECSSTCDDIR